MAFQKHQKDKLVEVALEGFAILDELYGRPKKAAARLPPPTQAYAHHETLHQYHHQYHQYTYCSQYRGSQVITIREPVIDSSQAAQLYGGKEIVDYSIKKPIRRAYN